MEFAAGTKLILETKNPAARYEPCWVIGQTQRSLNVEYVAMVEHQKGTDKIIRHWRTDVIPITNLHRLWVLH